VEENLLDFYDMQRSWSHEEYCTGLTQTEPPVWNQTLSQNLCNSIHQQLVASTLILMDITTGCRKGLKYLQVI